jgi:cytochrome P450
VPRALRAQRADIERIAFEILDGAAAASDATECDFVERIAAPLPIAVISWILGVPRDDWGSLFRWTNEVIGNDDPDYRLPRRNTRPDHQARAGRATRLLREVARAATERARGTIWSVSSCARGSMIARSQGSSFSRTAS